MQSACAVLYCHVRPAWLHRVFPHYLINDTIFGGKKVVEHKMCVGISLQLLSETFLILRMIQGDSITNVRISSCQVPVILVRFKRTSHFLGRSWKKNSNIKFYQNPASCSLVISGGQYDEANSRFSNFANAPKSSVSVLEKTLSLVTFDILSEITMKISVLQGMTPCRFGEKYRRFG